MNEFKFEEITIQQTQIHLCSYSDFDPSKYTDHRNSSRKKTLKFIQKHPKKTGVCSYTHLAKQSHWNERHSHYDDCGAPYMDSKVFISISHTKNKAGLAINKHYKIGFRPGIYSTEH